MKDYQISHQNIDKKRKVILNNIHNFPFLRKDFEEFIDIYNKMDYVLDDYDSKELNRLIKKETELFERIKNDLSERHKQIYRINCFYLIFITFCLVMFVMIK